MKENTLNSSIIVFCRSGAFFIKIFAFTCFLGLFGCKAKKPLAVRKAAPDTTVTVKAIDPKVIKINAIKAAQTSFNTFSGKARTKLNINGDANDVTLNIRIQRDKKIWISVTAIAGLEAARAVITPDSVMLINRLQDLYVKQPFSYINKIAGSKVNYKMLESIFIGNAIPETLDASGDIQTIAGNTSVAGNLSGMVYNLVFGPDNRVNQINLSNPAEAQTLVVNNSAFVQVGARVMPAQIDIYSAVKSKKIQVNLRFIKEDFDVPVEMPFSIPSRYTPAE